MEPSVTNVEVISAEIRWVPKCVASGFSNSLCEDVVQLMTAMFPDSNIATKLTLGRTEVWYIVNYGIAPHFRNLLMDDIQKSIIHVFSFYESMNSITQSCEMDVYIRHWHSLDMEVKVWYLGSSFFGKHQKLF